MAHAVRAVLLAMATVTSRVGLRSMSDRTQAPVRVAGLARRFRHVNVWGGCYGTDGQHIDQMSRQVAAVVRRSNQVRRRRADTYLRIEAASAEDWCGRGTI